MKPPKMLKTGTTIVGCQFKGGIVLGADTRATEGPIVADKNCKKIHFVAPNIYCCGAGVAADTEQVTGMVSSSLTLLRYETGKPSRVIAACTILKKYLFRYGGYIQAALVLGGVDKTGKHLYMVYPHGSTSKLPYVTMGSGSLAAMSIFESEYKDDMTEEEAVGMCHKAILAGIYNDLGSGSNCDICVIRKGSVRYMRGYNMDNVRKERKEYQIPKGTTAVLSEKVEEFKGKLVVEEEVVEEHEDKDKDKMVDDGE